MGSDDEQLSDLIGSIYDSALDAAVWPSLLQRVAEYMDSKAAVFRVSDVVSDQVYTGYTHGHEDYYLNSYREHYIHSDPYRPALKAYPAGVFYPGQHAFPYSEIRKNEMYNDLLLANGLEYTLGGFAMRDCALAYQVIVQRGGLIGDFTETEILKFNRLIPHFQRAFKINQHLGELVHQGQKLVCSLDQLSTGVLLCDEAGSVCYLNQKAEAIVSGRSGLELVAGKLEAKDKNDCAKLKKIIRDAVGSPLDKETKSGAAMTLQPVAIDERPLAILVAPLNLQNQQIPFLAKRACAIVFVGTPAHAAVVDARVVGMLYGLTDAEARLATELARGKSLDEICAFYGISCHTGRSQLKSIFCKTRTRRQAELVNLILTSPAAI